MRRFLLGAFVLGGMAAGAATAAAAEQERCSALPTAAERIVCYDRQFPPDHPSEPAAANAPAPSAPIATSATSPPAAPAAPPVATSTPITAPPARETEEQRSWVRGLFDKPERVQLAGTIKALRRGESQNTIYLLDNDQLWLQDSARQLPFRVGDAVTIENGTFGGYFMTSDGGTKARVRRIK